MIQISAPQIDLIRKSKIRPVRQSEIAECGLACLSMILQYWGDRRTLDDLRVKFPVTSRGMNLADIVRLSNSFGLSTRAMKVDIEDLPNLQMPAILHWEMNHFVVAEKEKNGKLFIVNPAHGAGTWHDKKSLDKSFTGIALVIEPGTDFAPSEEKRKLQIRELWGKTTGITQTIFQALILSIILQVFVLITPYFLQISIDEAIPASDKSLITALGLGFGAFALIAGAAHVMRGFVLLSAGTMLSYAMSTNVARHMLRLPISWFERRTVGDVLSRFQSVQPLRLLLTEGMAAAMLDGLMAILTLGMMFVYSPMLSAIGLVSAALYAAIRQITLTRERSAEGESIIAYGKEQGSIIETLRGMTTVRLKGSESMRQSVWQNRLSDMLSEQYAHDKIKAIQSASGHTLEGLENILTIWIGVTLILSGQFTIGMLFAFSSWRLQFSGATRRVIDHLYDWKKARLHLDRLTDIAFTKQDPGFDEPEFAPEPIKGKIELKGICHRYSDFEPYVLEDVDLVIKPGENLIITGPSGSGKTTLIKIILGLIDPEKGQVLIDGEVIQKYGRRAYRSQVSAVLQDDVLFAGTVSENVAGFTEIDTKKVEKSLQGASILEDIMAMPMKMNTLVGDMGSTLSGGQKQRILIARALYSDPRILVMDEGTSHLDVGHESKVNETISSMGITRIGIAHRKETIETAKRVIVLERGKIKEEIIKE